MGAAVEPHAAAYPSLMLTVPARILRAMARPRRTSRVKMLALSP